MSAQPHHWDAEEIQTLPFTTTDTLTTIAIRVVSEIPIDAEGNRLPRYGNRYYPTTVFFGDDSEKGPPMLTSDDCRVLSSQLLAAAALADAIDAPDSWPRCGHWVNACDGRCSDRRP